VYVTGKITASGELISQGEVETESESGGSASDENAPDDETAGGQGESMWLPIDRRSQDPYKLYFVILDPEGNAVKEEAWGGSQVMSSVSGYDIVLDKSGNVFIAGEFNRKVDFDSASGNPSRIPNGGFDAFILKIGADELK
jgi:hypothetical protein